MLSPYEIELSRTGANDGSPAESRRGERDRHDEWEPEPLHLPLVLPILGPGWPGSSPGGQEPEEHWPGDDDPHVVVIDLV